MRFRVLSMTVPLRSGVVSARELGRRRRAERRRNRQRRVDYAGERKEPVLRNVNVDALEVVRAGTSDLDRGRRLPCTGILRWSGADRLTPQAPGRFLDPPSRIHLHPQRNSAAVRATSRTGRHPAGRAGIGARGRAAHSADSGVMARRYFDAATGDVGIVRMDARAVRGRAAGCSSSPQRAGSRSSGSERAACRRECRHAVHSRRGLQDRLAPAARRPASRSRRRQCAAGRRRDPRRPACGCAAARGHGAARRGPRPAPSRRCRRPGAPVRRW